MSVETIEPTDAPRSGRELRIDFLYLDPTTCARCRGTERSLGAALTVVGEVLRAAGIEVEVNKVHVATEQQARALRFVSSPTIRVNGADIALELRESPCGSEACTDGCGTDLTERELQVLDLLARGRSTRQMAVELVVSPRTVERHIENIYDKAGVRTRAAATMFAIRRGLVDNP